MSIKKHLSDALSDLRFQKNEMSQDDLSKETGIPRSTIANYENMITYVSAENLCLFADYFETSTDYLLGRTDNQMSLKQFEECLYSDEDISLSTADVCNYLKALEPKKQKKVIELLLLLSGS